MKLPRALLLGLALAGLLGLAWPTAPAWAANPVEVNADTMALDQANHQAVFTGHVIVTRTGLTVWAPRIVVEYGDDGAKSIKSFTATGRVRIKTTDQDATGDTASFNPKTQILRLTGNVEVVNAAGTLTGPELVIDLANSTSVFSSGKGGRVSGVFVPQ